MKRPFSAVRVLSKPSGLRNSAVHSLALPRVPQLSMPVRVMIRIALQSPRLSSFFRMLTTDSYISRAVRYRGWADFDSPPTIIFLFRNICMLTWQYSIIDIRKYRGDSVQQYTESPLAIRFSVRANVRHAYFLRALCSFHRSSIFYYVLSNLWSIRKILRQRFCIYIHSRLGNFFIKTLHHRFADL